jgi:hypothetical protein
MRFHNSVFFSFLSCARWSGIIQHRGLQSGDIKTSTRAQSFSRIDLVFSTAANLFCFLCASFLVSSNDEILASVKASQGDEDLAH